MIIIFQFCKVQIKYVLNCLRLQQIKCANVCSKTKLNYQNKYKSRGKWQSEMHVAPKLTQHTHTLLDVCRTLIESGSHVHAIIAKITWISLLSILSRPLRQNQWSNSDKSMCIVFTPAERRREGNVCQNKLSWMSHQRDGVRLKFAIYRREHVDS